MRYVHTMIRITDVDESLDFWCTKFGLEEIRRVEVPEGKYEIILDEEGRYNGAELNHAASSIVGTQLGTIMPPIFGNVILCKAGALK